MSAVIWHHVTFLLLSPTSLIDVTCQAPLSCHICGSLLTLHRVGTYYCFHFKDGKAEAHPKESSCPNSYNRQAAKLGVEPKPSCLATSPCLAARSGRQRSPCILGRSSRIFCPSGFPWRITSQCPFAHQETHVSLRWEECPLSVAPKLRLSVSVPRFGLCPNAARTLPRSCGASWCVCFCLRRGRFPAGRM